MAYNFQTGKTKYNCLRNVKMQFKKFYFTSNKTLLNCIFIFRKQFYFIIYGLRIIGHGNPDNNLELICMFENRKARYRF
jgi:hypothetical protein